MKSSHFTHSVIPAGLVLLAMYGATALVRDLLYPQLKTTPTITVDRVLPAKGCIGIQLNHVGAYEYVMACESQTAAHNSNSTVVRSVACGSEPCKVPQQDSRQPRPLI